MYTPAQARGRKSFLNGSEVSDAFKAERYRIEREIGRGGMGRVFRAQDTRLGRTVALKMLPAEVAQNADLRRRLKTEAQAASALSHPAIAVVHDFVEHDGECFIVFEFVEGATVREMMARERLATREIVVIGLQLADGLACAHDHGVIHRDLKPENIMLVPGSEPPGRVKILDFGLAKIHAAQAVTAGSTTAGEATTRSTSAGMIVGTVHYMAPEQLEGRAADHRSDLHAVGLVLYELAAGAHPFAAGTPASTIANILRQEPRPITERNAIVPVELDRIVRKCLRKRPEERYPSARDLHADLTHLHRELAGGSSAASRAPARPAPSPPITISRTMARVLLMAISIGYLLMYGIVLFKVHDVFRVARELYHFEAGAILLTIVAVCGVAVRLYLQSAVSFDYADLGQKFRWLFPLILLLDEAWAFTPLLLLGQLTGLAIVCSAALAFSPFSQRHLVYAAYGPRGGRISSVQPRNSL